MVIKFVHDTPQNICHSFPDADEFHHYVGMNMLKGRKIDVHDGG